VLKLNRIFVSISILVIIIAVVKIVFHLDFWVIPLVFFAAGLATAFLNPQFSLYLFIFIFPFINSSPVLFDNEYPFNYLAPSLFLLSGIIIAAFLRKIKLKNDGETGDIERHDREFFPYYLFLVVLLVSTVFVFLRWSNIFSATASAFGADTPVCPPTPDSPDVQRISFASIFPVVSLFIYFISPYIFFYIKSVKPKEEAVFKWLSYGFYVSVAFGLLQKISGRSLISDRLGKEFKQFYGGFSDFNAFGFFSGVMFLWSTYEIKNKNPLGYVTFVVSLAGGILSGSRTVFFFILAGMFNLFYSTLKNRKKQQKIIVGFLIIGVLLLLVFAGGTLKKRLGEGLSENESLFDKINAITNGRLWMTLFTLDTIGDNFEVGVGTGNFTFYLAYKNYPDYKNTGKEYLYDLPLNHYFLVFAENGMLGFVFFTYFMIYLCTRSRKKLLIGVILFALLINNFFWFPEAFLLFWVLAALNFENNKKAGKVKDFFSTKNKKALVIATVLVLIIAYIDSFVSFQPVIWAQKVGFRYDYGFWYPEKDETGKEFRWTKEKAGLYLTLDNNGESPEIKLECGAPLTHLKGKKQEVRVFWKGKLHREFTFTGNKEEFFKIKSMPKEEGFLEIRVLSAFNLRKMGLGDETRDLGVKVFFLGSATK
jgi:hypothetical protein